jgi:two-component sensor histidine kinase
VKAELHPSEAARLQALRRYDVLDTPRERDFDEVVEIVSAICQAPISVINLIDEGRQWFKAEVGLGVRETPLDSSLCAHAILESELLIVQDTLEDRRFADNPLVTGEPRLRFYAGALLKTGEGLPIGTLCVLDYTPRVLDDVQKRLLSVMARQVMAQLTLRRSLAIERGMRASLEASVAEKVRLIEQNEVLRREIDHRVKNSLQLVASFLSLQAGRAGDDVAAQLGEAQARVMAIASVHEHFHRASRADRVSIPEFLQGLCRALEATKPSSVRAILVDADEAELPSEKVLAVGLAVNELVTNAFKHAFPGDRSGSVQVTFREARGLGLLTVSDDGVGGAPHSGENTGGGLGMRVLTALTAQLGAELMRADVGSGTSFTLTFALDNEPQETATGHA